MSWHRVIAFLPLLLVTVHAGDELTEEARRERTSRLRARAAIWYASRKGLITTCPDCQGTGTVMEKGRNRGGLETGEAVMCPRCRGDCKSIQEKHYRKAFLDMMSPAFRADAKRTQAVEDALLGALSGHAWPAAVEKWQIDRVELADASHGIVWARLNGGKKPTPMHWIRTDESNGKPEWFVYDEATDGPWPGGWNETDADGLEEIDWPEWYRRADAARAKGTTTLARLEALKAEAAKVVVVETVKIVDVEPFGEGAKIVVCNLRGGPWRTSVEVTRDDLPLVRDWGRWDRLTWRVRVVVTGATVNEVSGEILWDGPGSAAWSKNPGIGGYEIETMEPSSFNEWCAKFDAADAALRKEIARQSLGKALLDDAVVVEHLGAEAKVRFGDGTTATLPLEDPQAADEIRQGDTVVVARWPQNLHVVDAEGSRKELRFRLAVVARKSKGAD